MGFRRKFGHTGSARSVQEDTTSPFVMLVQPISVFEMLNAVGTVYESCDVLRIEGNVGRPASYSRDPYVLTLDNYYPETMHDSPTIEVVEFNYGKTIQRLHFPPKSAIGNDLKIARDAALEAGVNSEEHARYKSLFGKVMKPINWSYL